MNQEKMMKLQANSVMQSRAACVLELLHSIPEEDPTRVGLKETPWRVAQMYDELFEGYQYDAEQTLRDAIFSDVHSGDMVIVKDIPFYSMCEHHIMPFFGTISIGYIPNDGNIVGISKIARIAEIFARRLQVQERLGINIVNTMVEVLRPLGVAVVIKAEHTCMTARGVQKPGTTTVTAHMEGIFRLDEKARNEFYAALQL